MTDEYRGSGGAVGPPWSVDVLADLHAGVLDEREAAQLWPRVNADPEARAIIDALEATSTDLGALASTPVEPMPADVAARIDAALAQEAQARGSSNVVGIDAARRRRHRRAGWGVGLLAAAAAVVAAVLIVVPNAGDKETGGIAEPAPSGTGGLPSVGSVLNVRDFGPLDNEQRLDTCLAANDIDPDRKPVGIRPAEIEGRQAVVVLYTTGETAQYRLVALAADCGPDNPGLLRDEIIGKGGR